MDLCAVAATQLNYKETERHLFDIVPEHLFLTLSAGERVKKPKKKQLSLTTPCRMVKTPILLEKNNRLKIYLKE